MPPWVWCQARPNANSHQNNWLSNQVSTHNGLSLDDALLPRGFAPLWAFKFFFVDFYVYTGIAGSCWILLVNQFWSKFFPGPLQRLWISFHGRSQEVGAGVTQGVSPRCVLRPHARRVCSRASGWGPSVWVPSWCPWRVRGAPQLWFTCCVQKSENKTVSPINLMAIMSIRAQPEKEKQHRI